MIRKFKKGEIVSDLRNRYQGYRVKFNINNNQIKMYDKGNNLRIEVTINNPKDFKVIKEKEEVLKSGEIIQKKSWVPMGKSITNLYRYIEISKSITSRYIEALPEIDTEVVPLKEIERISTSKEINKRRYSGFNILNKNTLTLFQALSKGEYLIKGFNNKEIRDKIFKDSETSQNINRTTRLLAKLRAHKIIKKVPHKNSYYLTNTGRKIISSILLYTRKELLNT